MSPNLSKHKVLFFHFQAYFCSWIDASRDNMSWPLRDRLVCWSVFLYNSCSWYPENPRILLPWSSPIWLMYPSHRVFSNDFELPCYFCPQLKGWGGRLSWRDYILLSWERKPVVLVNLAPPDTAWTRPLPIVRVSGQLLLSLVLWPMPLTENWHVVDSA